MMKTIRGDFVWLGLSRAIITYGLTLVNGNDFPAACCVQSVSWCNDRTWVVTTLGLMMNVACWRILNMRFHGNAG